jgi:hypothetical protein
MAAFEVIALDTATPQLRAPGASDTYTFPRAVEMPLGTANGVLYLDGSKVVTSGSALTFDGTNLGIGGGGDPFGRFYGRSVGLSSASSAFLELNAATGSTSGIDFGVNASRTAGITSNTTSTALSTLTDTPIRFEINTSEQMRLDSTGLGIGTTPGFKLDVGGSDGTNIALRSTGTTAAKFRAYVNGTESGVIGFLDGGGQYFEVAGTEAMRLTSTGLGIGVTPSAWATYTALQTGWSALAGYAAADTALFSNAYFDGGYKYIGNGFASQYRQINSAHQWFTAPSGTAGDPISFTQAMTLDASGSLLVGSTSGTYRLSISVSSGADRDIFLAGVTGTSNGFHVRWINSTGKTHVIIADIPTSSAGLSAGTLWNDGGTLKIA